ncbi:MAG: hypothetical protein HRJ53_07690 [Acidobacteria bacterium Pan2503]|uniref:Uncharacterized protein n=1 Tax=Candidatus Acidiferrum panamense TaxID=2741543 RepID=A0A7V8NP85_9BACT|nr:hypothetical protein [Candidatus Acidoferrum panamensis]
MASPYSAKFIEQVSKDGNWYSDYVPEGEVWIAAHVQAVWGVTIDIPSLTLYGGLDGRLVILAPDTPLAGAASFEWEGRIVYYPGERMRVSVFDTGDFYVGGYVLSGPPAT